MVILSFEKSTQLNAKMSDYLKFKTNIGAVALEAAPKNISIFLTLLTVFLILHSLGINRLYRYSQRTCHGRLHSWRVLPTS